MPSTMSGTIGHSHIAIHQPAYIAPKTRGALGLFFTDLVEDLKREIHFDTSGSDHLVENHVNGLIIMLFAIIILFIIASYAALALAFHL